MRLQRSESYELERQTRQEERKAEIEERKRKFAKLQAKEQVKLEAKAAAGDPLARMKVIQTKLGYGAAWYSVEYWQAFADYEYQQDAERDGRRLGERVVNGVSVYEDHFAERVVETLQHENRIVSTYQFYHYKQPE